MTITNLVHGAGSLSHLMNRYLQTLCPQCSKRLSKVFYNIFGEIGSLVVIHKQSTVKKYLSSHFPPAFLYPVNSIISQPLLRGIARSLLFIGPAHKLNSTESIEHLLVFWLEPIRLAKLPQEEMCLQCVGNCCLHYLS